MDFDRLGFRAARKEACSRHRGGSADSVSEQIEDMSERSGSEKSFT